MRHVPHSDTTLLQGKRNCGALLPIGLLVLFCTICCVPPSVEDLSGPPVPNVVETELSNIKPEGERVSMVRLQGNFIIFDIRGAFENLADSNASLSYYWYVDWDHDNHVAPLATGLDTIQYFACGDQYDPPEVDGSYPATRTIMVVVSTGPLLVPEDAYLGAEEGVGVEFYDWTISFEQPYQCIGGQE